MLINVVHFYISSDNQEIKNMFYFIALYKYQIAMSKLLTT